MFLRRMLPSHHWSDESRDTIKLGAGLMATMAALVLGLLVASATSTFNSENDGLEKIATDIMVLDRILDRYGPEAKPAREHLRHVVADFVENRWPSSQSPNSGFRARETTVIGNELSDSIRDLNPTDDGRKLIRSQAMQLTLELARTRAQLAFGQQNAIPPLYLMVLTFWLTSLFCAFGLCAPRNVTVVIVLAICALSVSSALFLIIDLNEPFEGFLQVSSEPLRIALSQIGH
jgi:hypothetical protein